MFIFRCDQVFYIVPVCLSTLALDKVLKGFKIAGSFWGGLIMVFEKEFITFPHLSSDSAINPGLSVFNFGCFMGDKLIYSPFQFRCYAIP